MHDVVAHRISQVSMHAGALAYRFDLSAEQVREQAGIIEDAARAALVELRAVLGVLREPGGAEGVERPQPTYADLGELVEAARTAGTRVEVVDTIAVDAVAVDGAEADIVTAQPVTGATQVPDAVGRTVYRVVQEALTNASKHAPGAAVRLRLFGSAGEGASVVVSNALPFGGRPFSAATPSGFGLVGMAERVALLGGRLEHGVSNGVFTLTVWLPWPALSG
jgi:signal transduction histidine kinase